VMDMGDADHILLSNEVAKVLLNMDPWARYITHLGEVRVKHGVVVDLYNLYGRLDGPFCGNPGTPRRVAEDGRARNREARAARPKLRDILLPYRRTIVTWCVLVGLWYGANYHYKVNPAPYRAAFAVFKARVMPKVPKFVRDKVSVEYGGLRKDPPKPPKARPAPPPVEKVAVPSLVGKETHDADVLLQEAGLGVKTVLGGLTKYPQNTVYAQKPVPGRKVLRDTVVVLYVSKGLKGGAPGQGAGGNAPDFDPDKDSPDLPKAEDPGDGN